MGKKVKSHYTAVQIAKKYIHYWFTAANGKGHGIHSPFVFEFITRVLNNKKYNSGYHFPESLRKAMLAAPQVIEIEDFGAGSAVNAATRRKVNSIAASSLKSQKFGRLLYRITAYHHCRNIIELGTSLGITSCYLAGAAPEGKVITVEGDTNTAHIAKQNFEESGMKNITLIQSRFDDALPQLHQQINSLDLLFVDGNHQEAPTIHYFESFLPKAHQDSIFIFDDIHWSEGMENAWEKIKTHPRVKLTIDLFFVGIVFFKTEFHQTQHFTIRF